MSFTEKFVVGKISVKVMDSGEVMSDCKRVLREATIGPAHWHTFSFQRVINECPDTSRKSLT